MDILRSEYEKRILRLGINLFRKKIGKKAKPDNISKYLRETKEPALKELFVLLDYICENTKKKWQREYVKEYTEFAIYLAINNDELRKGLEGCLSTYSKYDNVKIDLEPNLGRLDKYLLEHIITYIIKKFSARPTYKAILQESYYTQNPMAQYIMRHSDEAVIKVKNDFMHKVLKTFIWFGTWVGINDTAYRHQFYYFINNYGNDELSKLAEDFAYPPEKWFINAYEEGFRATRDAWAKNELPRHKNSTIEDPCILTKQREKFKRYAERHGVRVK